MVILGAQMFKNSNQFTHLKIHTQYSICEGAIKIIDLKDFCKKNKIRAIGLSDTKNLCGALEFAEHISKAGTHPIIGSQINFKFKNYIGILPLVANTFEGYKSIISLSSKSFLENNINEIKKYTIIGDRTGNKEGNIISLIADFVKISTHLPYSGLPVPSMIPGISLNCLLTSSTTELAALPTAVILKALNKNGSNPPSKSPITT